MVSISDEVKTEKVADAGLYLRAQFGRGLGQLIEKCCPRPRPGTGGLIEHHPPQSRGRYQEIICLNCDRVIGDFAWRDEVPR